MQRGIVRLFFPGDHRHRHQDRRRLRCSPEPDVPHRDLRTSYSRTSATGSWPTPHLDESIRPCHPRCH